MPRNEHVCSKDIKALCKHKCLKDQHNCYTREDCNRLFNVSTCIPQQHYKVCNSMKLKLRNLKVQHSDANLSTNNSKSEFKAPSKLPPRMTAHKLHQLDSLWEKEVTQKPYNKLSKSQGYARENELAGLVLTSVVSKECIKQFGLVYLTANNEKIATHISSLVDNVKVKLEKIIRCDIVLNKENIELPPEEQVKEIALDGKSDEVIDVGNDLEIDIEAEVNLEVIPLKKQKINHRQKMIESKGTSVGISFLKATTRTAFIEMRLKVIEKFGLTKYDIPSYHYMKMHRPKFNSGIIEINSKYQLIERESRLKKEKRKDLSETKKNNITKLYYCKLDLTLYDSIVKLFEKCERKLCNTEFWQQKID